MEQVWQKIKFNDQGLIPVIVQEVKSGKVLMLAYMNQEALEQTLQTGTTWFYSRSRQKLWNKGEISGNYQKVKRLFLDCDEDALLVQVEQTRVACHTGFYSCFHRELTKEGVTEASASFPPFSLSSFLVELFEVIEERKNNPQSDSYTSKLFQTGKEKILRKISEETTEVILAALEENGKEHLTWEAADLIYHLSVLLSQAGIDWYQVLAELQKRRKGKEPQNTLD